MAGRIRMQCPHSELLRQWEPCKIHARYATDSARWRFGLDRRRLTRWRGRGLGRTRLATSIVVHLALSTVCMATRFRKSWSPGVNARRTRAGGAVSPRGVSGRPASRSGQKCICEPIVALHESRSIQSGELPVTHHDAAVHHHVPHLRYMTEEQRRHGIMQCAAMPARHRRRACPSDRQTSTRVWPTAATRGRRQGRRRVARGNCRKSALKCRISAGSGRHLGQHRVEA